MVEKIVRTTFKCSICGEEYSSFERAHACESRETEQPKYKVGDTLTITGGDGAGHQAEVTRVFHYEPSWGGEAYAHKVGYNAKIKGHWGSRQLIQGHDCV